MIPWGAMVLSLSLAFTAVILARRARYLDDQRRAAKKRKTLRIKDLCFQYPSAKSPVFQGVNFTGSGLVQVSGRNGCGKSTFLKVISGALKPTSGSIECGPALYVDQEAEKMLSRELTVSQHFQMIGCSQRVSILRAFTDLDPQVFVAELSGGQKQVVALCLALAQEHAVLCLDEFTSQMDDATAAKAMDAIHESARTILWTGHGCSDSRSAVFSL